VGFGLANRGGSKVRGKGGTKSCSSTSMVRRGEATSCHDLGTPKRG